MWHDDGNNGEAYDRVGIGVDDSGDGRRSGGRERKFVAEASLEHVGVYWDHERDGGHVDLGDGEDVSGWVVCAYVFCDRHVVTVAYYSRWVDRGSL